MADLPGMPMVPLSTTLAATFLHPGVGLALLLVIQVLNVFKPRGLTRYGRRMQRARQAAPLRTTPLVDPLRTQG